MSEEKERVVAEPKQVFASMPVWRPKYTECASLPEPYRDQVAELVSTVAAFRNSQEILAAHNAMLDGRVQELVQQLREVTESRDSYQTLYQSSKGLIDSLQGEVIPRLQKALHEAQEKSNSEVKEATRLYGMWEGANQRVAVLEAELATIRAKARAKAKRARQRG